MQTVGPYVLHRKLSSCALGEVWAARDTADRPFTVAVLAPAAAEGGWRDEFAAAANTLARSGGLPITGANHTGPVPWVACAAEQGAGAAHVFLALGQQLTPTPVEEPRPTLAGTTTPTSPAAITAEPAIRDTAAPHRPASPPPVHPLTPARHPSTPRQATSVAYPGTVASAGADRRGRTVLVLALVAGLAATLGVAGGYGVAGRSADSTPATAAPTPGVDLGLPTAPPRRPGVEPPIGGGWPTAAPHFAGTEPTREMTGLPGVGFTFRVPIGWSCTEAGRTSGSAHYQCGVPTADGSIIGGDLVVRQCPRLCTDERRTALRRQEEAWGLQWIRSGEFTTWAETARVDGAPRYGLVYLSYWRSVPEDAVDRQLVLRMTAPLDRADEVRKVAASVREDTFTL
ncbi:hypothetical protein ACIG87_27105 [Micromonospora sp. NPDC051925]|uniref:hypothetical protein n=1 Tax=Micromonospora sp. NPDC051925 TaxID=3364288 RepID=UPI0037CC23A1